MFYAAAMKAMAKTNQSRSKNRRKTDSTPSTEHERPLYYKKNKIEVWDAIEDWGLGFLDGNVVKYVARAGHKEDRLRDLKKARTYLDKMIVQLEAK